MFINIVFHTWTSLVKAIQDTRTNLFSRCWVISGHI